MNNFEPLNPQLLGRLSAETAVARFRELLYCEARYVGLKPDAITISANLYVPDGGIDAQVDSRFGFDAPVGNEAEYIAKLVERSDHTVTWSRFQEVVQTLRARRILQGDRTLFIVPWAQEFQFVLKKLLMGLGNA